MSNILSDPLFVRAEVEYRLERHGVRTVRTPSWPHPSRRRRPRVTWRRRLRGVRTPRPAVAPSCPGHP